MGESCDWTAEIPTQSMAVSASLPKCDWSSKAKWPGLDPQSQGCTGFATVGLDFLFTVNIPEIFGQINKPCNPR